MATVTENKPKRREVRYKNQEEVVADIRCLMDGGYETRGAWSLAQILEHLALGIDAAYAGFDFTVPWFARTFVAPLVKKKFIYEAMPAGYTFRTKTVLMPPEDVDIDAALEHFVAGLNRLRDEAPTHPHPFIGKLTHDQWKQLALRHAELHLSFVHPTAS